MEKVSWEELSERYKEGHIYLLPTDTVYGLHCRIDNMVGVERLKQIKERENRRFIILIAEKASLSDFGISVSRRLGNFLDHVWPGTVSCIFDISGETYAFRVPDKKELRDFIRVAGPLYSTSANLHGMPVSRTPDELDDNIKRVVDFYIDEGELSGEPSTIIRILR